VLHCDEETLSLLALGESGPAGVQAHLADCERCQAELASLRQVVDTARSPAHAGPRDHARADDLIELRLDESHWDDVVRITPPSRVWDQIAAATGIRTVPDLQASELVSEPVSEPPAGSTSGPPRPAPAAMLPAQRSAASRSTPRLLAIAAGCLVIGLLGGVLGTRVLSGPGDPAPTAAPVVAATRLDGLPAAPTASGQADVTESAQGRTLDLDVRKLGVPDGFYEVWLIDPTVTKMVPVGVLSGTEGRFSLPAGVDLADYPLVDVSVEPLDGNPAHSGNSVLRGTLRS
jgi:hypothetical protein